MSMAGVSASALVDSAFRNYVRTVPPLFAVSSPFLRPNGDVILHAADGHQFFVIKAILTIASPFFQSLFSLPQPDDQCAFQTVPVPEDGRTLDLLLRFCYPVKGPMVEDLGVAEEVLAAALKYEMEIVVQAMCRVLVSEKALETQPLRAYAIACQHQLVEETRLAAIATLRSPIEDVYIKEFDSLPAVHYFNLLKFHRRVKSEICFVLRHATRTAPERYEYGAEDNRKCPRDEVESIIYRCSSHSCRDQPKNAACWWTTLVSRQVIPAVHSAPLRPDITEETASDAYQLALSAANRCESCETNMGGQWNAAIASLKDFFSKIASEFAEKMDF